MRDSGKYLALQTLAVFAVNTDVSVTYLKLLSYSTQCKHGAFSLLPFFFIYIFSTSINTIL